MSTSSSSASVANAALERCRQGLAALVARLGGPDEAGAPLDALFKRWEQRREALGGWTPLATNLGCKPALVEEQLNPALRQLAGLLREDPAAGGQAVSLEIAALRLLSAFEQLRETNPSLALDTTLPADEDGDERARMRCFKQVRALELVLRGLIDEAYGDQSRLVDRLAQLRGQEQVAQWQKVADPGDILSGTAFSDLSNLVVDKQEYAQHYDPLFKPGSYLRYLKDQRSTLQRFLDDIRRVRNQVAHHKKVTTVQTTLLDLYYAEIVMPLQLAFDDGRSGVNPDRFFDASAEDLATWQRQLGDRVDRLGDDVGAIKDSLGAVAGDVKDVRERITKVQGDTLWLRHKMAWSLGGIALLGVVGVLTFGTSSKTLGNTEVIKTEVAKTKKETSDDPRKELSNRGVAWTEQAFRDAVNHGDADNTRLFMDGAMHWRVTWVASAVKSDVAATVPLLTAHADLIDPTEKRVDACGFVDSQLVLNEQIDATQSDFLKKVCGGSEEIAHAKQQRQQMQEFFDRQKKAYDEELAKIRPAADCERELLVGNGEPLMRGAATFSPGVSALMGSLPPRDMLLLDLQRRMGNGARLSPASLRPIVNDYCETQAAEKPNIAVDDRFVKGWDRVLQASR